MTADQVERMCFVARDLLSQRNCGRKCDPEAIRWAETLLRNNVALQATVTRAPAFDAHETDSEGGEL